MRVDEYTSVIRIKPNEVEVQELSEEQIEVYEVTGCSFPLVSVGSDIYDHTDNIEGVYDTSDHVSHKTDVVDSTYDHAPFHVMENDSHCGKVDSIDQTEQSCEPNTKNKGTDSGNN